jgi:hypothetical protein
LIRGAKQNNIANIFKPDNFVYNIIDMIKLTAQLLLILLTVAATSQGAEVSFELSAGKTTIAAGEGTQLILTFSGDKSVPQPKIPPIDDFQVNYIGSSTRMSMVNGVMSSSVSYNYSLVPMKRGEFKIGPFSVQHDGKTYTSNAITLNVTDAQGSTTQQPPGHTQQKSKGAGDIKDRVFITLRPSKTTVYVNEIFTVKVKLHVRDISVGEVSFPQVAEGGFSVSVFDKPVQIRETIDGISYETLEFTATAFAATTGDSLKLGPASLECNIMIKETRRVFPGGMFDDDFFNNVMGSVRAEPVKLKSGAETVKVLPLPQEGKPKGFKGAIGKFELNASVTPENVKTGDPVTLKIAFTGKGNFNSVTKPQYGENTNLKYYEPQTKQDKDSKTFEEAIIPLVNTVTEIPEIVFSFFDPDEKIYKTIKKGPFPIKVTGAAASTAAKIVEPAPPGKPSAEKEITEKEILVKDVVFIKEHPGKIIKTKDRQQLYQNPVFLLIQILPLLIFTVALIHSKRVRVLRNNPKYVKALRAPKRAKEGIKLAGNYLKNANAEEFYNAVHKTVYEYLGDKLHLPPGDIAGEKIFALLQHKGIETQLLREIFNACDIARYARPGTEQISEMERIFKHLEDFIVKMQQELR